MGLHLVLLLSPSCLAVLVSLIFALPFLLHYFNVFTLLTYSDILDVFVRFDRTLYTTTETKGNVTVWIHVDRVIEPFIVALIPGEGDVIYNYKIKK